MSNKISKSSLRIVSSFPAPYLNIRHVTKGLGHHANSQPWLSGSFVSHCLEFRTHYPSETRLGSSSTPACQFIPKYREFVTRFWKWTERTCTVLFNDIHWRINFTVNSNSAFESIFSILKNKFLALYTIPFFYPRCFISCFSLKRYSRLEP